MVEEDEIMNIPKEWNFPTPFNFINAHQGDITIQDFWLARIMPDRKIIHEASSGWDVKMMQDPQVVIWFRGVAMNMGHHMEFVTNGDVYYPVESGFIHTTGYQIMWLTPAVRETIRAEIKKLLQVL